jgi:hypothetical protein
MVKFRWGSARGFCAIGARGRRVTMFPNESKQ